MTRRHGRRATLIAVVMVASDDDDQIRIMLSTWAANQGMSCMYTAPPLEVQNPQVHPSQASPAHTYTVGSKGRPGVSMSRLLAGLQASRATVRYDIVSLSCLKAYEN